MIASARRRIIGMLTIVVLLTYSDSVFSESPTTWNQTAELQKAIHDTNRPDRKNLAEEDTPSLRIPPATQESRSNGAEPGWLFIDYAKIDKYEEQISNMRKDQQEDIKKILGLMRIGKVPSQSLSWVKGTTNPAQFTLRDWDIKNARFTNSMIVVENGQEVSTEQPFLEAESTLMFLKYLTGAIVMDNTTCRMDMRKAVISKPHTAPAEATDKSHAAKSYYAEKWPFHYGSFFIFDDDFEKKDVSYYEGSNTIVMESKRTLPHSNFSFPGTIEFKGELCRNLAFSSDYRE